MAAPVFCECSDGLVLFLGKVWGLNECCDRRATPAAMVDSSDAFLLHGEHLGCRKQRLKTVVGKTDEGAFGHESIGGL